VLELLDVALVDVELGDGVVDLGVGQHAELLALDHQALDLFEFLKFRDRHTWFRFFLRAGGGDGTRPGPFTVLRAATSRRTPG
jgi:hypothetical protein